MNQGVLRCMGWDMLSCTQARLCEVLTLLGACRPRPREPARRSTVAPLSCRCGCSVASDSSNVSPPAGHPDRGLVYTTEAAMQLQVTVQAQLVRLCKRSLGCHVACACACVRVRVHALRVCHPRVPRGCRRLRSSVARRCLRRARARRRRRCWRRRRRARRA